MSQSRPSGRGSSRPRTSGVGPRAARRTTPADRGARPAPGPGPHRGPSRSRTAGERQVPQRARFTGRAAILVLVLAVLVVSYASSMRAYLEQRRHLAALAEQIDSSQTKITALEREKKRWDDPAYVRATAHQRFGWVLPGEIGFQVIGKDGRPLDHEDTLGSQAPATATAKPLWWQSAWGSVVKAGQPERSAKDAPQPVDQIRPPKTTQKSSQQ